MKLAVLYCCLFSFASLVSSSLNVKTKGSVDIFRDKDSYTFAADTFKVKVPSYNVDKKMRELSDEKLEALLNNGSYYIDLKRCSDKQFVANLQGRIKGGGFLLGEIGYYGTKIVAYSGITVGVVYTIVRNVRADRDARAAAQVAQQVINRVPNLTPFEQMPRLSDVIPQSGVANQFLENATPGAMAYAGFEAGGVPGITVGGLAGVMAANPAVNAACQHGVWEFIAMTPRLSASNSLIADLARRGFIPNGHVPADVFAQAAVPAAAAGRGILRGAWGMLCKRCGEIGAVVEVVAQGARCLGRMVPGPI